MFSAALPSLRIVKVEEAVAVVTAQRAEVHERARTDELDYLSPWSRRCRDSALLIEATEVGAVTLGATIV